MDSHWRASRAGNGNPGPIEAAKLDCQKAVLTSLLKSSRDREFATRMRLTERPALL